MIADSRHTTTPKFTKAWLDRAEAGRQGGVEAMVRSTVERWSRAALHERDPAVNACTEMMIRNTSEGGYRGHAAALARLNYIRNSPLVSCGSEDHGAPPRQRTRRRYML